MSAYSPDPHDNSDTPGADPGPHGWDDFHVKCASPACDHPRDPVCLSDCCGEETDGTYVDETWAHADCAEVAS